MNPESLKALLIDQQLGELSTETSELLDAYLAQEPGAAAEAVKMREVLSITDQTVNDRADLFRAEGENRPPFKFPMLSAAFRGGAVGLVLLLVGVFGYFLGQNDLPESRQTSSLLASAENSPWAQYRLSDDLNIALVTNLSERKITDKK